MDCRSNENEINNAATELANIIISAANFESEIAKWK
jgi:hypothetical protein